MKTQFYHTVNEGLYLLHGDTGILFDGIHTGSFFGYSDTRPETIEACLTRRAPFDRLKALVFSHKHADHFDEPVVRRIALETGVAVYAPAYENNTVNLNTVDANLAFFKIGDVDIFAFRTIHDGDASLQAEPHVSFVVNTSEETFFLAGDALFHEPDAQRILDSCEHLVDTAFVNAYQIMPLGGNLPFLRALDPGRVVLYHKPYREDDRYNLYRLFETAVRKYPKDLPELIQPAFDSWIPDESDSP